jgi:hypothetical protein
MKKWGFVACVGVVLALAFGAVSASADPTGGPPICNGPETPISGTYNNLWITGNKYVADFTMLKVRHNLTIAPGACLDAFTLGTVHVKGDIHVGVGAILGLGCTPNSIGPVAPCFHDTTKDTVDGTVRAERPLTMYLDGDTIHGNLISDGGGPGPTFNPYINFPIKDNVIGKNVRVTDWKGAWFGLLRNKVGGNVTLLRNIGVAIGEFGPDSNEVATNVIGGNLLCDGNHPLPQIGDSGGTLNTVGGAKLKQCSSL